LEAHFLCAQGVLATLEPQVWHQVRFRELRQRLGAACQVHQQGAASQERLRGAACRERQGAAYPVLMADLLPWLRRATPAALARLGAWRAVLRRV
jgi:hypothetical protein